jgi:uncharacterized protein YndB with AHSA1/START domain
MHRVLHIALGLAVASLLVGPACGAVKDAAPNGFSVVETVHIAGTPDKVYAELIQPAHWWSSQHTFSQSAANLTLDAKAGGCWCEALPDGSVQHLVVVLARPGKKLVMRGALGPLQGLGVDGALTVELKPAGAGTDLTATYNVGGYLKDGLTSWAGPVDSVLGEQFSRLKTDVETGAMEAKP